MMSIPKAKELAREAGITVGAKRISGTVHTIQVGRALCRWDTTNGGAACWRVLLDGAPVQTKEWGDWRGYAGEAIAKAVRLQSALKL